MLIAFVAVSGFLFAFVRTHNLSQIDIALT